MSDYAVTIVVPTYNRPKMLDRLIESIGKQTYGYYNVIIVDDHSECNDKNEEIIQKYADSGMDISYLYNEENMGAPFSRNRGIRESNGDLIALVDDDDEWLPEKLECQVSKLRRNKNNIDLIYTWADMIDSEQRTVHNYRDSIEGKVPREILQKCFIPSPTVLVKRDIFSEVGGFDTTLPSRQDWDMWVRILTTGHSCGVVKKKLAVVHRHNKPRIGTRTDADLGKKMFYRKHYQKYLIQSIKDKDVDLLAQMLRGIL